MDKMSFGEVLRTTRERKGLDLNATARRLRIRPDILQAIEESNFSAMPPRGYARNMVNGYARYLGLNPTEITGMYLDELYAYQVENESARMRPTGIEMPDSPGALRSSRRDASRNGNRRTYYEREEREAVLQAQQGSSAGRSRRSSRSGADRLYPESRTHQARGTVLPSNNYTNFYSGPGPVGFLQSYWRQILAGLAALIVLLLLLSQIWSCTHRPAAEEPDLAPVMPSSDVPTQAIPKAPTSFTFEYSVEDGAASWIEVYVNDQIQVGEVVEGPQTRSFTSSDKIQFITANPYPVTVKIDGSAVELEPDADGLVNMTWNFSDILAKWLADHPGAKASSTLSAPSGAASSAAGAATGAAAEDASAQDGSLDSASGTEGASDLDSAVGAEDATESGEQAGQEGAA